MTQVFLHTASSYGTLFLDEILDFYDEPLVATLTNEIGNRFLASIISHTRENNEEVWIIVPVSPRRLEQIKVNGISVRDAFLKAEMGVAFYAVIKNLPERHGEITLVTSREIPEKHLPTTKYHLPEIVVDEKDIPDDIQARAVQLGRFLLRFRLALEKNRTEVPISLLGTTLKDLQALIYSIGQVQINGSSAGRGPVPKLISQSHELFAHATMAGSFIIEMVSGPFIGLFDEKEIIQCMDYLQKLIEAHQNPDELKSHFEKQETRVYSNFLELLKAITSDANIKQMEITWASPENPQAFVLIKREEAIKIRDYLATKEDLTTTTESIDGRLIGANLKTKKFSLVTFNGEKIDGKCTDASLIHVNGKTIGEVYLFTLEKATKVSYAKPDGEVSFTLLRIEDSSTSLDWPAYVQ